MRPDIPHIIIDSEIAHFKQDEIFFIAAVIFIIIATFLTAYLLPRTTSVGLLYFINNTGDSFG